MQRFLSYFSFRARANRQRYWMTVLSIFGLFIVSVFVAGMLALAPLLALVIIPVWLALFVANLANAVRRLHDRNKSAWWLLLFMGVPTLFLLPASLANASSDPGAAAFGALCGLISLPFSIWAFVEMGCLRGTAGPNKYGDDPLQPAAEVFA